MKLNLRYFFCIALLLMFFQLQAQVQFAIKAAVKEIGRKDELQVDYEIEGAGNSFNFQPPDFEGWQLLAGPIISSQSYTINGKRSSLTKYSYYLSPKGPGKLKIPTTFIEVNNKAIHCSEVVINVKKQDHVDGVPVPGSNNALSFQGSQDIQDNGATDDYSKDYILKPGEDAVKKIRNNLFVKAIPSKRKVYVGEPVLIEYKLYTRLKSVSRIVKQPTFNGCSVIEMTTEAQGVQEILNGRKFTSYIIRKVQLIPLQQGKLDIGQASLENDITFLSSSSDYKNLFYDQPAGDVQTLTLSSDPFSIEILPLPKEAVNHAVGNFSISTRLKKDTSAANESNSLIVTVLGSGNFKSVTEPEIKWNNAIYHFDAIESDDLDKLSFPLTGKKVFEIPFEVNTPGKIEIPAVALPFFDPAKGEMKIVKSDPLLLAVIPAKSNIQQSSVAVEDSGFSIKLLLCLIALAFIGGTILILRKSKKKLQPAITVPEVEMEKEVVQAKEINAQERYNDILLVQDDAEFYSQVSEFAKEMIRSGKGDHDILLEVLKDCNTMLYTPLPTTGKKETLEKLQRAIA